MKFKSFTKKRVMSLLLSVLMVMGMLPLSAFAMETQGTLILGDTATAKNAENYECWYYDANGNQAYSSNFKNVLASSAAHDANGNAGQGTIYLLKDVTVTSTITNIQGTSLTIESDGGNFGITCTSGTAIEMMSGSSLTLNNVDVTAAGSRGQAISVPSSATLTLNNGCYIEANGDSGVYCATSGTLNVKSGTIIRGTAGVTAHGTVNMTGGSIGGRSSDGLQLYIFGSLNMSGGEIYGSSSGAGIVVGSSYDSEKKAKATITGGTVTKNGSGATITGYGTVNVSGDVVISGGSGIGSKQLTVTAALGDNASILFSNSTHGAVVAVGSGYTLSESDAAKFNSYSDKYIARLDSNSGSIVVAPAEPPVATVLWGDADGDGNVDAYDASLIKKYSVGLIGAEDLNPDALDLDGDHFVDAFDASLIQKYSVHAITSFPIENKND